MSPERSSKAAGGVVGGAAAAVAGSKLVQKAIGEAGKLLGADPDQPNRATQTLTVSASPEELFDFFRDTANFQRVLRNVADVRTADDQSVHWDVPGPGGHDLQIRARLAEERPGELLRWAGDGASPNELEIRLRPAPTGDGTAITMRLGAAQGLVAGALVVKTLYRTKALFETGEVPTLEKNPSARPGQGDRI
jgi:uncharacterized membrane protein